MAAIELIESGLSEYDKIKTSLKYAEIIPTVAGLVIVLLRTKNWSQKCTTDADDGNLDEAGHKLPSSCSCLKSASSLLMSILERRRKKVENSLEVPLFVDEEGMCNERRELTISRQFSSDSFGLQAVLFRTLQDGNTDLPSGEAVRETRSEGLE